MCLLLSLNTELIKSISLGTCASGTSGWTRSTAPSRTTGAARPPSSPSTKWGRRSPMAAAAATSAHKWWWAMRRRCGCLTSGWRCVSCAAWSSGSLTVATTAGPAVSKFLKGNVRDSLRSKISYKIGCWLFFCVRTINSLKLLTSLLM